MKARFPALIGLAGFSLLVGACLLWASPFSVAQTPPERIRFQIATGAAAGTFFPIGEAIAGLVSHPFGVARCDAADVCGPAGLIVSARTSQGAVDNLIAVNRGDIESGLAQSDVIAAAVKGAGAFRKLGRQTHVRVIASLFAEEVHLVVAARSKIKSVADLKGKRVSLGSNGSGDAFTAREILLAYRLSESALKAVHEDSFEAGVLMKAGKLDAFFAVGGVPLDGVGALIASGQAHLVPIDGAGRTRLLKASPSLAAAVIPAGSYGQSPLTQTVSARALWVVRDSAPEALVHGMTRALFHPKNKGVLAASHPSGREISIATAALAPPAPLHPGAARFYREAARR